MESQHQTSADGQILFCASCDRCRSRKTKCDGNRPCENCKIKYKKKNKLDSLEGIDPSEFDCIYSPAKRRGPVPGKSSARKAELISLPQSSVDASKISANNNSIGLTAQIAQSYQSQLGFDGTPQANPGFVPAANNGTAQFSAEELKQMLLLQQQLLMRQQQQTQQGLLAQLAGAADLSNIGQVQQQQQQQPLVQQPLPQFDINAQVAGGGTNVNTGITENIINNLSNLPLNSNGQLDQNTIDLLQQYSTHMNIHSSNNSVNMENNVMNSPTLNNSMNFQAQNYGVQPSAIPPQEYVQQQQQQNPSKRQHRMESNNNNEGLHQSILKHLPLLDKCNPDGSILRSYYELSINDVLNLPPIPSDDEYCDRLHKRNLYDYTPNNLPTYDQSVLRAARFAELALGALSNDQTPLALELSNASVLCMRNCGDEPVDTSCMYEVARAYLLHGIFRSFRGDFVRYFKYRRVCMAHVGQALEGCENVEALIAAVSFHDALAYMLHNASEDSLPDIDEVLPRVSGKRNGNERVGEMESKYGCSMNATAIAGEDYNQMWMQGAPPVFLNNEANLANRSLDGLACAIRSCCDQANSQFQEMAKAAGGDMSGLSGSCGMTATSRAVMANENELCSRNLVLSSRTLLEQHQSLHGDKTKRHGLLMMSLAMDAFLENSGENDGLGGFTDKQIRNLLSASDIIVKNPLLLHSAGPVYHMMTNAAIMLCHLLNGLYASCRQSSNSTKLDVEEILFGEVLDSFMAMRKLLSGHRKGLPAKLRCHGLPKVYIGPFKKGEDATFIDMGDAVLCSCRGCQGFVLMGCSPCVAAERSAKASQESYSNGANSNGDYQEDQFERDLQDMGEFDIGDDTLLNVLSRFVDN